MRAVRSSETQSLKSDQTGDDVVRELLRGARQHLTKFVPELQNNLLEQAQVGLGHAFSRCKVKAPS